jgi:hypothetical protein
MTWLKPKAILPKGERLEFGKHRQDPKDAETAPAWPALDPDPNSMDEVVKRMTKKKI